MTWLKKWRQATGDPDAPIYVCPGLLDYAVEVVSGLGDPTIRQIGGLGPMLLPHRNMLVIDRGFGLIVGTGVWESETRIYAIRGRLNGEKVEWMAPWSIVQLTPAGRLVGAGTQNHDGVDISTATATVWRTVPLLATVSLLLRRNRTIIERVTSGKRREGNANYRGDAYVIRGIADVLTRYRKLDQEVERATGGKQRWHMRAGCWVNENTDREHWRNPYEAGDERLGRIYKDYTLEKYRPRQRMAR